MFFLGFHILTLPPRYFLLSRCINIGPDFQAELPPCFVDGEGSGFWSLEEECPREQLLWKPWGELEESTSLQSQGKQEAKIKLSEPKLFLLLLIN